MTSQAIRRARPLIKDQLLARLAAPIGALLEATWPHLAPAAAAFVASSSVPDPRGVDPRLPRGAAPTFALAAQFTAASEITRMTLGGFDPQAEKLWNPSGGKGAGRPSAGERGQA